MRNTVLQRFLTLFTSKSGKKIFLVLSFTVLLYFVCDDVLMPWFVRHGGTVRVPSVVGTPFEEAKHIMDSLVLEARQGDLRTSENFPTGTVIAQNPLPGTMVKKGRRVYLVVSGGEQLVQVPPLRGKTVRDAKFALERNGLTIGMLAHVVNDSFPINTVIDQSVAAFTKVRRGFPISVTVSKGVLGDRLSVPDVIGKSLTEAGKILANHGFGIGTVNYLSSTALLPNTVVDQYPRSGELIEQGRAVDLFVVRGGEKKKSSAEN